MTDSAESAGGQRTALARAPDFFIVGQPKSGTTALYRMLGSHPQLYLPELKEPMFLASDLLAGLRWQSVRGRPQTLEEYLSLFASALPEQLAGEASALYLSSRSAAANIVELQPRARIVAILREPVGLLGSLHLQSLQDHNETEKDLRKALALEGERRQGRQIPSSCARPAALYYSEHIHYVEQLRRFRDVLASERVLVLIYDDFRDDNVGTVRQVLQFLEVDDSYPIEPVQANLTVRLRSPQLDDMVKSVAAGRGVLARALRSPARTLMPRAARQRALRAARRSLVYGEPRRPDEALTLELRRRFKHEVVALSEYLDRDLVSLWCYDSVD